LQNGLLQVESRTCRITEIVAKTFEKRLNNFQQKKSARLGSSAGKRSPLLRIYEASSLSFEIGREYYKKNYVWKPEYESHEKSSVRNRYLAGEELFRFGLAGE
jgi:hypothetical protein